MYILYRNEEVRNLLNVAERTVTKARKELADAGLIRKRAQTSDFNQGSSPLN